MNWKLTDAKNRFSEVFRLALQEGPQKVNRRDESVVILSNEEYERLLGEMPTFKEYLFNGPDLSELDLDRDKSPMRDMDL